jgi:hypothetical protein
MLRRIARGVHDDEEAHSEEAYNLLGACVDDLYDISLQDLCQVCEAPDVAVAKETLDDLSSIEIPSECSGCHANAVGLGRRRVSSEGCADHLRTSLPKPDLFESV